MDFLKKLIELLKTSVDILTNFLRHEFLKKFDEFLKTFVPRSAAKRRFVALSAAGRLSAPPENIPSFRLIHSLRCRAPKINNVT